MTANFSNLHDFQPSNSTFKELMLRNNCGYVAIARKRLGRNSALFKEKLWDFYLEKLNLKQ